MKFRCLGLVVAAAVIASAVSAEAQTLSVVGASTKICQLTGDTDWQTGAPTAAQTNTNFGLLSVDLGFPVDSDPGPLYFLFGDAFPLSHPPGGTILPDDALGFTTRTAVPDSKTCLDLQLVTSAPKTFAHPTVTPAIQQGTFNVPSGGVFLDGKLFAFFWTNHCALPNLYGPNPTAPQTLPPPSARCAEIPLNNSLGRGVLASALPAKPAAFTQVAPPYAALFVPQMPSGFVYVSAAVPPVRILKNHLQAPSEIPVFGVPRYRESIPYLALAPRQTFGAFMTWSFFAGMNNGAPQWITYQQWETGQNASGQWAPPSGAQIFPPNPPSQQCVGEHSETWNAPLQMWLMLYTCGGREIEARVAPEPWGPWSKPTAILSAIANPGLYCTLFMNAAGCPGSGLQNYWPLPNGGLIPGYLYAPFVMSRYTQDATQPGGPKQTTIYWLLSTFNPYQVTVMTSTLQLSP